jgi:hypothetical protein
MIFRAYNFNIQSDTDLKIPLSSGNVDLHFLAGEFDLPPLKKTKIFRYNLQAKFGDAGEAYYLYWPQLFAFKITKTHIYYKTYNNPSEALLKVFLLSEALGLLMFKNGSFLLHGSAVNINNLVTVFLGKPGAGKSTTVAAFAVENFNVLADDMVVINFNKKNQAMVTPAFGEIKIWQDASEHLGLTTKNLESAWEGKTKFVFKQNQNLDPKKEFVLNKILILSKTTKSQPINKILAPIELLKYFPLAHQLLNNEYVEKHYQDCIKITETVEIEILNRPKSFVKLLEYVNTFK